MVARAASVLFAACCFAAGGAVGGETVHVRVTATIPPLAQFRVVAAPQALEITPEDILRGHVDVPLPSIVVARTNLPGGFAVRVLMDPQLVTAATVTGLAQAAHVAGDFALLRVPGSLWQETRYELRWRLELAPQVRAGSYAWPVRMQLDAL